MEDIEEWEMEYEEWRKLKSIVFEHRLVEEHHNNDEWYCCCSFCKLCDQPISGGGPHHKYYLYYYCCKGCDFFLHKSCAELPLTIVHPHSTICDGLLQFMLQGKLGFRNKCFSCGRENQGFGYHCCSPSCGFNLDFPCALAALLQPTIAFGGHEHRFTLWTKKALFTCDACGTTHHDKGYFYMCTECQLCVHQDCATLHPNTIKHNAHIHPLTLKCYFPPREYSFNPLCEICSGDTIYERLLYHCCEGCNFSAHVNCAKSKTQQQSSRDDKIETELIEYQEATHLPVQDISIHLVTQIFKKKISLLQEENQTSGAMEEEIKHFSHEHPLTLSNQAVISSTTKHHPFYKDGDLMRCQACTRPISEYHPFYSCTKCKYFIHKSCSELPTEIMNHPFHPVHTLTLVHKTPYFSNFFTCNACRKPCNGFAFRCASCNFDLDLTCSSISGTIIHEAHKHPLVCRWYLYDYIICNACNLLCAQSLVFGCVACGFSLHIKCALLPRTVRNGQRDEHPLTLSYCLSINESEEYLCDTCEKDVDPQSWFYYCAECDDPLHPECISSFNGESNILFGNKVDIKGHPHPLTVTRMTRDKLPCDKCGYPCSDISFHCEECKFNLDRNCARVIHDESNFTLLVDNRRVQNQSRDSRPKGLLGFFGSTTTRGKLGSTS